MFILIVIAHFVLAAVAFPKLIGREMAVVDKVLWAVYIIFFPLVGSIVFLNRPNYNIK